MTSTNHKNIVIHHLIMLDITNEFVIYLSKYKPESLTMPVEISAFMDEYHAIFNAVSE